MSVSVRQALRILELLAPHPDGLRVTDLAETLGLNRAVPHRLLAVLMELGYVEHDPVSSRYRATFKLGAVGLQQLETGGMTRWAQARLDQLAAQTKELVRMAAAIDDHLYWVARAQGANSSLIIDPVAGTEAALHATATGKAWLSTLSDDSVKELVGPNPLPAITPNTVTSVEELLAEIAEVRTKGYALVFEEVEPGVSAIAAPILATRDGGNQGVGTVSIAGPSARLERPKLESMSPMLLETASSLGREWIVYEHLTSGRPPVAMTS